MTAEEQARVEAIASIVGELTGEYHEVCQAVAKRIIFADPATAQIAEAKRDLEEMGQKHGRISERYLIAKEALRKIGYARPLHAWSVAIETLKQMETSDAK